MNQPGVISIDVGGTLIKSGMPSLTTLLVALSPLSAAEARSALRQTILVRPALDEDVVAETCSALRLRHDQFPRSFRPPPPKPVPGAEVAIAELSCLAPVVTLSNVTCLELGLDCLFHVRTFRSCDLGHAKPDARAFAAVAREYGVDIGHVLHVGDDWECDAAGAVAAGAGAVWLSFGRHAPPFPPDDSRSRILIARDLADAVSRITARFPCRAATRLEETR
jgi:FMN hydrolase / 5-amino-6-(5-phospho-D-ribitylamino)uracil phosphatase